MSPWRWPAVLILGLPALGLLTGCSQITLLRTQELRQVELQVDSSRDEIADVQKSIDDLSLKQGGTSSQMRADLTTMLTDLQTQISSLHADIDETQHRLSDLSQRLDRLEQRKIVVSGGGSADSGVVGVSPPFAPTTVKVVEGLDIDHLFSQAREDYIQGRYDLAYQGFKNVYDQDSAGSYKEQALYWMGECLWKGEKGDEALDLYQRVLSEFPAGDKACAARFKIGLIYSQKQDITQRDSIWNELLTVCPGSNEADRAQELMKP